MIKLTDYIKHENLLVIQSVKKNDAITEIVTRALENTPEEESNEKFIKLILKDKSITNGVIMGKNFLLSHTRNDSVNDIIFKVGLCTNEVQYNKKETFSVIFFIILPESKSHIYLSLIARLGRFLSNQENCEVFYKQDFKEIEETVRKFDGE